MALERPPGHRYGSAEMLKRYRPPAGDVSKHHRVGAGRSENLETVAKANQVSVEALVALNFPGAVENGRIVPEVVNWYLAHHADFRCPETADKRNRLFKGGEQIAIPKATARIAALPAGARLPPGLQKHASIIRSEIKKEREKYWHEFEDSVSKEFGVWSTVIGILEPTLGGAETLRRLVNLWIVMREWGCAAADIVIGLKVLATEGKDAQPVVIKIVNALSTESAAMKSLVVKAKVAGIAAALIGALLTSAIAWGRGDYHIVVVELYKFAIGYGVPWAALLDTFQSLIAAVWPGANTHQVFKYFRAINPVALGGIAVDSLGTVVTCFIEKQGHERRLGRLTERMKEAGAGVFVEMGNDLGDAMFTISQMSDKEFDEAMSLRNIGAWLRSLVP